MDTRDRKAVVVGAGVIGLTTALRLLEAGWQVTVVAHAFSPETTSDVAAAVWLPYRAYPPERVLAWARRSFEVYASLAGEETGVSFVPLTMLYPEREPHLPFWATAVRDVRRLEQDERPPGFVDGLVAQVPLIETPRFMPWLMHEVERCGGVLQQAEITDLANLLAQARVVVNSSGLGARSFADDPHVFPIRGQIVRLERAAADVRCLCVDDGPLAPAYVIPRRHDVICGGTAQDHDPNLHPDDHDAETILARCRALVPSLAGADVLAHRVGLRPGRSAVRLEAERHPDGLIVHNYGHGGSGYTLCWGCAEDVLRTVAQG